MSRSHRYCHIAMGGTCLQQSMYGSSRPSWGRDWCHSIQRRRRTDRAPADVCRLGMRATCWLCCWWWGPVPRVSVFASSWKAAERIPPKGLSKVDAEDCTRRMGRNGCSGRIYMSGYECEAARLHRLLSSDEMAQRVSSSSWRAVGQRMPKKAPGRRSEVSLVGKTVNFV